jgi:xanthine dehydrogenase molybdopterin-binding subunit B
VLAPAGVRSTRALAALVCVDASAALALPGVVSCLTAADIPGRNDVFGAPLLAGEGFRQAVKCRLKLLLLAGVNSAGL